MHRSTFATSDWNLFILIIDLDDRCLLESVAGGRSAGAAAGSSVAVAGGGRLAVAASRGGSSSGRRAVAGVGSAVLAVLAVLGELRLALVLDVSHEARVALHVVGDGLDAGVGQQHAVLALHAAAVRLLLVAVVVALVVLHLVLERVRLRRELLLAGTVAVLGSSVALGGATLGSSIALRGSSVPLGSSVALGGSAVPLGSSVALGGSSVPLGSSVALARTVSRDGSHRQKSYHEHLTEYDFLRWFEMKIRLVVLRLLKVTVTKLKVSQMKIDQFVEAHQWFRNIAKLIFCLHDLRRL